MLAIVVASLIVTTLAHNPPSVPAPAPVTCNGCESTIYEGYKLESYGKVLDSCAESVDHCYEYCLKDQACSAVSFRAESKTCILAYCAFTVLTPDCSYSSKVRGNPVIAGAVLPVATHHFVLTDQCGSISYGSSNMAISTYGLKFNMNLQKPRFGNAMGLPGDCKNGTFLYARTNPHASLRIYGSIDTSFTIAFFVRLEELINVMCFTELRTFGAHSLLYWMWPDTTKLHYNQIGLKAESTSYSITIKKWHHFVITYDAATSLQRIFIGDTLASETTIPWAARNPIDMITIGGRYHQVEGLFRGSIYCYSLFNQALTRPQILAHRRACSNDGHLLVVKKTCQDQCCS